MNVLVLNCGSSSVKYQVIDTNSEVVLLRGLVEKIGEAESRMMYRNGGGEDVRSAGSVPDHEAAMGVIRGVLGKSDAFAIHAVGHRVVHGGEKFFASALIDADVEAAIQECAALAPLHNPPNLTGIRAARRLFPDLPHVAVFDTAFHQTMPREAWCYALPWELYEKHGVRRYGFHGTSHRYVAERAAALLGISPADFTGITLHLGNGCSAAAIQNGRCVDTSMGLTPLEGLVMGTRCGDIDPAILFYLADKEGLSLKDLDRMLNRESGLKGVSGVSNDVRELESAEDAGNDRARLALDVFARRVRRYIGGFLAVLDAPQAVVLTGGIGEHGTRMRARILKGLDHIGIRFDDAANQGLKREGAVTAAGSPVAALVVPTNEELMIARETRVTAGAEVKG